MSDGTSQSQRQPSALAPTYFRVDETSWGQLVMTGTALASHLRFYDAQARSAGTWADLFEGDELIVMGSILGHDARALQALFDGEGPAAPSQRRVTAVLALAATIDRWWRLFGMLEGDGARALATQIRLLVQRQLASDMRWFGATFVSPDWRGKLNGYAFGELAAIWFEAREPRGPADEAGRDERLRQCFTALRDAIEHLKDSARAWVPVSQASEAHEPAAALWLAFAQMFLTVQERVNAFTARHTDFYYHDVLGMRPRSAEADSVHIACEAVPGTPADVFVPKGTMFSAGIDHAGRPVEFVSEGELAVTDLRVASCLTLRLERGKLMLDDEDGADCVKRIRVDAPGESVASAPGVWPLFGGELRTGASSARDARIGFGVASGLLALREGRRRIALALKLQRAGDGGLWGHISDKGDRVQWQMARAFPQMFDASITTADGWHEVAQCSVSRGAQDEGDVLHVTLHLSPDAPPVTRFDEAVHGSGWNTAQPVLRLLARPDASPTAYALLQDMVLAEMTLAVRVEGARDLVVANQVGRIDPSMPFMPFGPLPQSGSYFAFGSPEAAAKPLTLVRLNVDWGGLPQDDRGFAAHYEGYDSSFDNAVFRTRTTVLQDGQWRGGASTDGRRLFRDGPGGRLAGSAQVDVPIADLNAYFKPQAAQDDGFEYAVGSRGGFFRLELSEPRAGFGHAEYPRALTRVVASNARRRRQEPMPRPPYTPTIERVTLDYEASASLKFGPTSAGSVMLEPFHVHPFGIQRLGARSTGGVLPLWAADGNLHIGLAGSEARGVLTLLFALRPEAARPVLDRQARVRWSYLAGDRWNEFESSRLIGDTTRGFLTCGIVTLDLPADVDTDHSVMPSGLFWLRLSADREHDTFAGLEGVRAHAVRAVRSAASSLPTEFEPLPAGSITGPVESIAGLARAMQVGPSFGMRPSETAQQLRVRTGERLKHKSRALLPWDYERLVLERFPSVLKVRCLPGAGPRVVVLPALASEGQLGYVTGPTLHAIELECIRAFLQKQATPFARVTVRNASYEGIQVRCTVRFRRGVHPGEGRRRVHRALFDYLSPWSPSGLGPRFDWLVRREDIEACLRQLECVASADGVSLVHVAEDDFGRYTLADTARPQGAARWEAIVATGASQASARQPWSVAIPVRSHLIHVIDNARELAPRPTGIGQLGVGTTFILGGDA